MSIVIGDTLKSALATGEPNTSVSTRPMKGDSIGGVGGPYPRKQGLFLCLEVVNHLSINPDTPHLVSSHKKTTPGASRVMGNEKQSQKPLHAVLEMAEKHWQSEPPKS